MLCNPLRVDSVQHLPCRTRRAAHSGDDELDLDDDALVSNESTRGLEDRLVELEKFFLLIERAAQLQVGLMPDNEGLKCIPVQYINALLTAHVKFKGLWRPQGLQR